LLTDRLFPREIIASEMAECRRLAIDGPPQPKPPDDRGRSERRLGIRCRRHQDLGIRQAPGPERFEVDGASASATCPA
jgi:hypothetical protein